MYISDKDKKFLKVLRVIAKIVLVAMPAIFLVVAYLISDNAGRFRGEGIEFVAFMLLIVATFTPIVGRIVDRSHIASFRSRSNNKMTAGNLFFMISIIKIGLAEFGYFLGLVGVLLGMEMTRMLWFYPIAIIWSYIYWPRESSFEKFLTQVENK